MRSIEECRALYYNFTPFTQTSEQRVQLAIEEIYRRKKRELAEDIELIVLKLTVRFRELFTYVVEYRGCRHRVEYWYDEDEPDECPICMRRKLGQE